MTKKTQKKQRSDSQESNAKGVGLGLVLGVVAYFAANYLPLPIGTEGYVKFVGTAGALAGSGMGWMMAGKINRLTHYALTMIAFLFLFVVCLSLYIFVAEGEPGRISFILLLVAASGMFLSFATLVAASGHRFIL